MCSGLISYFRGDLPISYPKINLHVLKCKMSDFQYELYKIAIIKEKKQNKKISLIDSLNNSMKLSGNFYISARIISNITFPNKKTGHEGFDSINKALHNIKKYSIKFYIIYKKVIESIGPVFIYSQFLDTGGLKSLIKYFEYNEFSNYNNNTDSKYKYAVLSSNESLEERENIKKIFNNYNNKDGKLIKILFGSPAVKEGISLLRVSQVHILEPYWNMSRIKQIIGRAVRYCSHKDLPIDRREVDVYIYIAIYQTTKTIDEYIWNMAKRKSILIDTFEHALKEVAIDCNIFYNRNYYPTDNKQIICK